MTTIYTDNATPPGGHYSQAVTHAGLVYVSGQLGFKPGTTINDAGTIQDETLNCLRNLEAILLAANSSISRVLRVTIYVSDVEHWPLVNDAYAEFMGDSVPARTIVPCNTLHHGFNVEIDAIGSVVPPGPAE